MKLLIRIFGIVTIAIAAVGLTLHLSAASLNGSSALARDALALSIINLAGKMATIVALIGALACLQRGQLRWLVALVAFAIITVLSVPLGELTNTDLAIFILAPFVTGLLSLAYSARMGEAPMPSRAWWKPDSGPSR